MKAVLLISLVLQCPISTLCITCIQGKSDPHSTNFSRPALCSAKPNFPHLSCAKVYKNEENVEYMCMGSTADLRGRYGLSEEDGGLCKSWETGDIDFVDRRPLHDWRWICFCFEDECNTPEFGEKYRPWNNRVLGLWLGVGIAILIITGAAIFAAIKFRKGRTMMIL